MPEATAILHEWETFYVIVGSASAGLMGLMFVVVALGAEQATAMPEALSAFGTPTVVHFGVVLLIGGLVTMPRHGLASLALCFLAVGLVGLGSGLWVVIQARRQRHYTPVAEDWIWHVVVPVAAYAGVTGAALALRRHPGPALYAVAVSALLLLYAGVHNAWDSAVYIASKRPQG